MNSTNIVECDSATFEMRENYLYIKYKDESIIDLPEAKIQSSIILDLCDRKKVTFVIDLLGITTRIEDGARDFFANNAPYLKIRKAQAVLVNNIQSKLLTNFYIKFHKPQNQVKVFNNLPDALDWLKPSNCFIIP
jgi:hypothetical protein